MQLVLKLTLCWASGQQKCTQPISILYLSEWKMRGKCFLLCSSAGEHHTMGWVVTAGTNYIANHNPQWAILTNRHPAKRAAEILTKGWGWNAKWHLDDTGGVQTKGNVSTTSTPVMMVAKSNRTQEILSLRLLEANKNKEIKRSK